MSHELRTPLNSLLILSRQLADNADGNLSTSRSATRTPSARPARIFMTLINEILDLAKIESATMAVDVGPVRVQQPCATTSTRPSARSPRRRPRRSPSSSRPTAALDRHRRHAAPPGAPQSAVERDEVHRARACPAPRVRRGSRRHWLCVSDTGIGIPRDKQRLIFEAFQQADGFD